MNNVLQSAFEKKNTIRHMTDSISSITRSASGRHDIASMLSKNTYVPQAAKGNPILEMTQSVSSKVRHLTETVRVIGKNTVKPKTASSPRIQYSHILTDTYRGMSNKTRTGIEGASQIVTTMFSSLFEKSIYMSKNVGNFISETTSRGFDVIKSNLTDFGSPVNLSKTASKINITPRNTTRDANITTVGSIIKNNISLLSHNNAIKHTRY